MELKLIPKQTWMIKSNIQSSIMIEVYAITDDVIKYAVTNNTIWFAVTNKTSVESVKLGKTSDLSKSLSYKFFIPC